jgi:hypothetical protein
MRRHRPLLAVLAAVVTAALLDASAPQTPPMARDPRPPSVARLTSLDELLPKTPSERVFSESFVSPGPPLRPGLNEVTPSSGTPRPERPPGSPTPTEDEIFMSWLCFPGLSTAVGTPVSSRVITNGSRSVLLTIYTVSVREWITGNHEAEIFIGTFGGRVFVADEEYATPKSTGGRNSLNIGTSYVLYLSPLGRGAYVLTTMDPAAIASGRLTLRSTSEPEGQALDRLRQLAKQCKSGTP